MTIEIAAFNPPIEIPNRKIYRPITQIIHRNRGRFRVLGMGEHDLGQSNDGSILHRVEVRADGTGVYKTLPRPGRERFSSVERLEEDQEGNPQRTGEFQEVVEMVLRKPGQYAVIGGTLNFGRTVIIHKIIRFRR